MTGLSPGTTYYVSVQDYPDTTPFSEYTVTTLGGGGCVSNCVDLEIQSTIAVVCDPSINMNAIIGTGKSTLNTNNQADCIVTTNNANGYKMEWQASTDDMINANTDHFAAYSPAVAETPGV